ncbi:MAG: carboxypeptidase regulatory-like domain-containing protein [Lentimicrobiaceae bacterium]|nr:carboxypeptidase regulatory-like domain-containing protein [Lentimicrobiaceae bacterium]
MKKTFTLLLVMACLWAQAQYSTPGTGVSWNLDSLVTNSAGAVILNGDHYEVTSTILILPSDSLSILDNVTVFFHDLTGIESSGILTIDAPSEALFTAIDSTSANKWRGIKLESGHVTNIKNASFRFGGGMRVIAGTFSIDGSTFYKNYYKSGSTSGSYASSAALDISGLASVTNCSFTYNQRGAIASGSNIACRANIRNNYIFGNTTENSNRPQINMGPAGENDTTFIVGNTVIGNGNTSSGGIAYSSLVGVAGNVVIESNVVDLNRYGITLTGSPINGAIRYNTITNNNIQGDPNLGGSGINFTASSASSNLQAMVTGNIISGNLWGITIIGYPQVNMGDSTAATFNPGGNQFSDNGNGGILYDLYNNGPVIQKAMYNCWGVATQDSASIETVVVHAVDNATLGLVKFMPSCAYPTIFTVENASGSPLQQVEISIENFEQTLYTNASGTAEAMLSPGNHLFTASLAGYNTYNGNFTVTAGTNHVNVTLTNSSNYLLTFHVTDTDMAPLAGAEISVASQTLTTNSEGMATITLGNGTYPYTVSKEGYISENGSAVIANGNTDVNVQLTAVVIPTFVLSFQVNNADGQPLEGVSIEIEGQPEPLLTNSAGTVTIELPDGTYSYNASLQNYETYTGSVEIAGANVTENIVLQPDTTSLYTVTFTVDSNMGLLSGAEITINGETLTTNDNGVATIQLTNGTWPYTVTAIDFITEEGSLTVWGADVNESVYLLLTGISQPQHETFTIYPNPVTNRLYIKGNQADAVEIYSQQGTLLQQYKSVKGSINLSGLGQGTYLIRLISGSEVVSKTIVKQ